MSDIIIAATIAASAVVLTQISLHGLERWKGVQDAEKEDLKASRESQKLADARRCEMKKDQYLRLLSGISDATAMLGQLINAPSDEIGKFAQADEARRAIALKDVIANRDLMLLSIKTGDAIAAATFALLTVKAKEVAAIRGAEGLGIQIEALLQKSNQAQQRLMELRSEGKGTSPVALELGDCFQGIHDTMDPLIQRQQKLIAERQQHVAAMARLQFKYMPPLAELASEPKIAIRKDLGFNVDDEVEAAIRNREGLERMKAMATSAVEEAFETFGIPKGPGVMETKVNELLRGNQK